MDQWLTPTIIVGAAVGLIAALIGALVALRNTSKQLTQARQQQREQFEHRALEDEARHKQTVQAFVDYLYDVRSLNKPPKDSGQEQWDRAYRRLDEVRGRVTTTLSRLPPYHLARGHLERLADAFLTWADEWDRYGECANTHEGARKLTKALSDLQGARSRAEEELRDNLSLPKPNRRPALKEDGRFEIDKQDE